MRIGSAHPSNPRTCSVGRATSPVETDIRSYREHTRRTADYGAEDWKRYHAEHGALCARFAALAADGAAPDGAEALQAARDYAALIDRCFYPCDAAHLGPLAEMYEADTRFQETFNGFGAGTAAFIIKAFRACASG
ncbi:TipAS antibiotic-recognition domain-containing protein [Hoeflea sp.]|uniref:TipAS antibiotic-recognition domain-containing protein n=1 Tax=Hoeflea sp. TaxID=1940281 RepID=UPI003B01BAFB